MKPVYLLRVRDLRASERFYCQALDFRVEAGGGTAVARPASGPALLLAGPAAGEVAHLMNEVRSEVPPGRMIHFTREDGLDGLCTRLSAFGADAGSPAELEDGSRALRVTDPDGHVLGFWQPPATTDEELLQRYASAPVAMSKALDGLAGWQLDLTRAAGKWTIRQTVHHVADSAATSLPRILMALAEPGRAYRDNPYDQDVWTAALLHESRPVETSLALLGAIHAHVTSLAGVLPGAFDRTLETSLGGSVSVRSLLRMLAGHVAGHAAQIRETRRVHGV